MIESALQGDDAARLPPGQIYIPTIPSPQRVRAARLLAIALVCFAFSISEERLPQLYSYFVEYFSTVGREKETAAELDKWVDGMSGESDWGDLLLGRGLASLLTAQIFSLNGDDRFLDDHVWMLPLEAELYDSGGPDERTREEVLIPLAYLEMPVSSNFNVAVFILLILCTVFNFYRLTGIKRDLDALRSMHRSFKAW